MKLLNRRKFSSDQLNKLKNKLSEIRELSDETELCIYTTGSYGRLEASKFSDIDLFFLTKKKNNISKINKTIIDANIISACRGLNLPEFSGDGEYLEIHIVDNILDELGSREDDFRNYFTARMLLLLESKPLYNKDLYNKIITETIDRYYKDFHDHYKDFQPVFLVNDIIRFWRTMCLNYEHSRNRKPDVNQSIAETRRKKIKSNIKNLKLKFSRKLTCYSMLLCLLWGKKLSKNEVIRLIKLTPMERLEELRNNQAIRELIDELISLYEWFLNITQVKADYLYIWISKESNKVEAFQNANRFGKIMFEIMLKTPYQKRLQYYLV